MCQIEWSITPLSDVERPNSNASTLTELGGQNPPCEGNIEIPIVTINWKAARDRRMVSRDRHYEVSTAFRKTHLTPNTVMASSVAVNLNKFGLCGFLNVVHNK